MKRYIALLRAINVGGRFVKMDVLRQQFELLSLSRAQTDLLDTLRRCGSGKELIGRGFAGDVQLAGQLNVSDAAPLLVIGETYESKPAAFSSFQPRLADGSAYLTWTSPTAGPVFRHCSTANYITR